METFGCRINMNGGYILNIYFDILKFLDKMNDAYFVEYQINLPLVVGKLPVLCNTNDNVSSPIKYILLICPPHHKKDIVGVSSFQPFNENQNKGLNQRVGSFRGWKVVIGLRIRSNNIE